MSTEDLGAPAYRKYDVEAWMPGLDRYGEVCVPVCSPFNLFWNSLCSLYTSLYAFRPLDEIPGYFPASTTVVSAFSILVLPPVHGKDEKVSK